MRYYDCFTYFNEIELLKVRLEELKPLNPIHVLVESSFTHTGDPKQLNFANNIEKFKEYNIRHIVVNDMPNNGDAWDNEGAQRDAITRGLYDCKPEDVIGIFDLDEIPKATSVAMYEPYMGVVGVKQDKHSYYLNCIEGYQQWEMGRLCTFEMLKKASPNIIRNSGFQTVMCDAGWHISFLGGVDKMIEKFFAYAHTETVTSDLVDPTILKRKVESGQSLWGQDFWRFVEIDETFPKYIQEHQEELKHLIHGV